MADAPATPAATPAATATPATPAAPATPSVASTPAEPKPAEPTPAEPKPAEPKPAEPKPAEPAAGPFDPKAFKPPEGVKIDPASLDAFAGVINDSKLSAQERGAKLIELHNAELKKVGEANTKSWSEMQQKWVSEVKADPILGGDKVPATVATIAKAIDSLGAEGAKAFREALDVTGAGNHPAVVRALHAFASQLVEGKHVPGNPPSGSPDTKALFFPNSPEMKGTA